MYINLHVNLTKPTGHVVHQRISNQQLYAFEHTIVKSFCFDTASVSLYKNLNYMSLFTGDRHWS